MGATATVNRTARELARGLSPFEIDQALAMLIESAQEEATANSGELSEELKTSLADYVEAFGEKVDRIANYLKAQESFADLARREAARLEARRKSAENRVKGLKTFLCFFMASHELKRLQGPLTTITLVSNSAETLVLDEAAHVPDIFHKVSAEVTWNEWEEILAALPAGPLKERLIGEDRVHRELDRARLSEALKAGVSIAGARLVRDQHMRIG
jgi:Siphovirus Gp157